MDRERIYTDLHKLRACTARQHEGCKGDCKNCIYAVKSEEALAFFDTLIQMYRPKKIKRGGSSWFTTLRLKNHQ